MGGSLEVDLFLELLWLQVDLARSQYSRDKYSFKYTIQILYEPFHIRLQ